jgi:hypothetical protein
MNFFVVLGLTAVIGWVTYLITRPAPIQQESDEEIWSELYVPSRVYKLTQRDVLSDVDSLFVGGVIDEDSDEFPVSNNK